MSQLLAYRLVKRKWLASAFDGEGARRYGGRWNSRGQPCIYLAGSESLAILEVMVHLEDYQLLQHYALLELQLSSHLVLQLPREQWPRDWREEPAPASTAELGDTWLASQSSLALAVPSVVVPREHNYLLNPTHPQFKEITEGATLIEFEPDRRL
ncbi:RES family NAD+ phosphorylase [Halomonas sp. AOP35-4E-18]|uniref:RES family NAD+ phosphorylase n=1 Tax=Halomonas sp. AOP35-4E-18 TaxID=3457686 RepID=UPI0040338747